MRALDLFAGTGWGVACQRLGIEEEGVELMPEAVASRAAAGMATVFHDVWEGIGQPTDERWGYDLLIGSPPCQTFSTAGAGAGRRALDEVLELLTSGAYLHPHHLRDFGERHDPRTALVLTPLTYVARDLPRFVVLEQVPPVLPVWEAMAVQLRANGYSVVTGVVNAEQYGVPQTRRRAILIARRDGVPAAMPAPTHSRYYPRDPQKMDPGVLPWVSMAEALERGAFVQVSSQSVAGGPRAERPADRPSVTITSNSDRVRMRSNYGTGGDASNRGQRDSTEPAPTVTSKIDRNLWTFNDQSGTPFDADWPQKRPATVLAGRDIVQNPGATANRFNGATKSRNDGVRVSLEQAAVLQSYPADFPFQGTRTKRFLQVGNAVPPRLAEAILGSLIRP